MKMGEHPPEGVKKLVLELAGTNPRPTNKEIREAVQRRFEGIEISYRTISRYCSAAVLPRSTLAPNDGGQKVIALVGGSSWCAFTDVHPLLKCIPFLIAEDRRDNTRYFDHLPGRITFLWSTTINHHTFQNRVPKNVLN